MLKKQVRQKDKGLVSTLTFYYRTDRGNNDPDISGKAPV
jgi:hypothetical protein